MPLLTRHLVESKLFHMYFSFSLAILNYFTLKGSFKIQKIVATYSYSEFRLPSIILVDYPMVILPIMFQIKSHVYVAYILAAQMRSAFSLQTEG